MVSKLCQCKIVGCQRHQFWKWGKLSCLNTSARWVCLARFLWYYANDWDRTVLYACKVIYCWAGFHLSHKPSLVWKGFFCLIGVPYLTVLLVFLTLRCRFVQYKKKLRREKYTSVCLIYALRTSTLCFNVERKIIKSDKILLFRTII